MTWLDKLPEKMRGRIAPPDEKGCTIWLGARQSGGYGEVWLGGRDCMVHRVVVEAVRGPIPEGLVVDHLCRNPSCCNPDHLEAVSQKENVRRGLLGVLHVVKTVCKRGHDKSDAYFSITKAGHKRRTCRVCNREQGREARRRSRARRASKAVAP